MPPKQPKVFISYAREDAPIARRLFDDLKTAGAEPWLDVENILPGQRWESEIEKAIKKTDFVIALLSSNSLQKRGFIQKELRFALSLLDEIPQDDVFLIPARLDDCRSDDKKLREINWVDLFPFYEIGLQKLMRVIRPEQATRSGTLDSAFVSDDLDLAQAGWGVIFPQNWIRQYGKRCRRCSNCERGKRQSTTNSCIGSLAVQPDISLRNLPSIFSLAEAWVQARPTPGAFLPIS